jgi:hypothetical protein
LYHSAVYSLGQGFLNYSVHGTPSCYVAVCEMCQQMCPVMSWICAAQQMMMMTTTTTATKAIITGWHLTEREIKNKISKRDCNKYVNLRKCCPLTVSFSLKFRTHSHYFISLEEHFSVPHAVLGFCQRTVWEPLVYIPTML